MKTISRQMRMVGAGYVAVLAISACLVLARYIQYVRHPEDAVTYGSMWAFGDTLLALFIGGLFLVPTFFLIVVIAKSEAAYTTYSKVLLGLSLTAPLSLGLLSIPAVNSGWLVGGPCFYRLLASPAALALEGFSRLMARFPRAKQLTLYALLIEVATLILIVAWLFVAAKAHEG